MPKDYFTFKISHTYREDNRCVYGLTNLGIESAFYLV